MKSNDDSRAKHKAISCCLSYYFGFRLSENGSVLSVENVSCMTCHKSFAYDGSNTSLIYYLQCHIRSMCFYFLTKINY